MGVVRKWAPEEDAALRFHYPLHGMYWPGWGEVLPGRSVDAVYSRAAKLGPGTCEVECYDDGVDEGMDGEWYEYAPQTWYLSCGHEVYGSERPCYCSTCGRKVVG